VVTATARSTRAAARGIPSKIRDRTHLIVR
jgi:hypothetical protein